MHNDYNNNTFSSEENINDNDTLIVVLGGGESGVGSAILAKLKGFHVFLSDGGKIKDKYITLLKQYNIDFEEGQHDEKKILSAHEIIKSPGISLNVPIISKITKVGIPIISEIEFAGRYTNAKMICVTGSNGKTTTASLIFYIMQSSGLNVGLGGNIGDSFARQVAENDYDYYVLELSSFQLEDTYNFKADIAVILNISPDHLDRYDYDMQKYVDAKMRIIRNQKIGDAIIYWLDDPIVTKELEKLKPLAQLFSFTNKENPKAAGYVKNEHINIIAEDKVFDMEIEKLALQGMHNVYNSLASGIVAKLLDISNDNLRQALSDFKGVPHRLEKVATVRGVQYINDSKATNINSCWYALHSMRSKVVLILGGTDKGNDYNEIEDLLKKKVRGLIFLGKDNSKLKSFFADKNFETIEAASMEEAVTYAYKMAHKGDTVLLSPACASFDLFENYEDRGNQFKEQVRRL